MARIDGFGISVELPSGFEGEVFGHQVAAGERPAVGVQAMSAMSAGQAAEAKEAQSRSAQPQADSIGPAATQAETSTAPPVLHAATFPLPPERGDFGNGAVDHMGADDVFVALCEYDAASVGTALFASEGFPRLTAEDFSTSTLHRSFENHSGCQKFFHVGNRAFCLYIVLGSHTFRSGLVRRANEVIERIEVATA